MATFCELNRIRAEGLAHRFAEHIRTSAETPFAFLLGAGASVSYRKECHIKSAQEMVKDWILTIYRDRVGRGEIEAAIAWADKGNLGIEGFNKDDLASKYAQVYAKAFATDPQAGVRYIQSEIDKKTPDLGYYLLAQILANLPPKLIITTNFDNHALDALSAISSTYPILIGHEALAVYAQDRPKRPTVIKIHRDLFFDPKVSQDETKALEKGMASRVTRACYAHPFLVIGYGGNDDSLMDVLDSLDESAFPGGLYWCWYENGTPLSKRIIDLISRQRGFVVPIGGFNELMFVINDAIRAQNCQLDTLTDVISRRADERKRLVNEALAALVSEPASDREFAINGDEVVAREAQERFVQAEAAGTSRKDWTWWQWEVQARNSPSSTRREVYEEAIKAIPDSGPLLGNYANFLWDVLKEFDEAESLYRRAIEANPTLASTLGNYALFLSDIRKDYVNAEKMYIKAIQADPDRANNLTNYAIFLENVREDYDNAEVMFKRAIEAEPNHANSLCSYATFLVDIKKDYCAAETMFKRAIDVEPNHVDSLGNYALLLSDGQSDADRAEKMYQRAIEANPTNATALSNYAVFLKDIRKSYDEAERMFERAIEAEPNHANALGNYALFLSDIRNKNVEAEIMFRRAIDSDPDDAEYLSNFARFLICQDRTPMGLVFLSRAEDANESRPLDTVSAELAFYRYAIGPVDGQTNALGKLFVCIVNKGIRTGDWSFEGVIEQARRQNHSQLKWLHALADVLADRQAPTVLDEWDEWQDAKDISGKANQ